MKTFLGIVIGLVAITVFWMWFNSEQALKDKKIVAIGDSLIEGIGSESGGGFVSMLSQDLGVSITNLGKRGDTTEDVLKRIKDLNEYKPEVVILLVGGNDFLRGVPAEIIFKNLELIIDEVEKSGAEVLLLGLESHLPGRKYGGFYEELVEEKNIQYVPNVLGKVFGIREYMADGLHPNDQGYRIMADYVKPYLVSLLKP